MIKLPVLISDSVKATRKSTVAVVYTQIYYTVSAEPEKSASDYFKEGADLKILGSYEPAYVSSVDYGRKIILLVSGELSEQELSAKVNGLIKGVQIGAAISNVKKDEQLDLQIMTYGGADMSSVLQSSDKNKGIVGEFREWLWGSNDTEGIADRLNDFLANRDTLINPVPLSYRLKYLSDNAQVPAMYINEEEIALADNAQLITLSASEELQVDITSLPAILLNKNEVYTGNKANQEPIFNCCVTIWKRFPSELMVIPLIWRTMKWKKIPPFKLNGTLMPIPREVCKITYFS